MKFKKIQTLLRQIKTIQIRHGESAQWIGDSAALYPIYNLPELNERAMQTILDIDDDAWDKFDFEEFPIMKLNEEDVIEDMEQLDRLGIILYWKGKELIPLVGDGKIYYIQSKYLKPFDDDMLLTYWLRNDPASLNPIIGVQEGMCLAGLVMPIMIDDKVFCETLYRVYELTKREVYGGDSL